MTPLLTLPEEVERDREDIVNEEVLTRVGHVRILVYVNFALIVPIIFWAGAAWQRVTDIDTRLTHMQNLDGITQKVDSMSGELDRLRNRLDKFIDDHDGVRR